MNKLRVLFWGMGGLFSRIPLEHLLTEAIDDLELVGVVVAASRETAVSIQPLLPTHSPSGLPLLTPAIHHTITHLAWERNIPVFAVRQPGAERTIATLSALQPDVACVACFPYRLPPSLLNLPHHGFLNLHPSLLPHYRGPDPLFWQWQRGETQTGVTVHHMDDGLDTGPIAGQTAVALPDGIGRQQADTQLAEAGAVLFRKVLKQLATHQTPRQLKTVAQSGEGSQFGWPEPADFQLEPNDSAQRAFNFMRGTAEWKRPYRLDIAGETVWLRSATGYTSNGTQAAPIVKSEHGVQIQFSPGILFAR